VAAIRDATVRYARAGEVNIAYQVFGGGPPDVLYVPGLLNLIEATAEEPAIERHLEGMAAFARVVIFDKRGTGLSDRVPVEEMADGNARVADLTAVMDAAGLSRAALFATADGATPAILFAARHPARVDALVIYAGTARWLATDQYPDGHPSDPGPPLDRWNERWGNEVRPLSLYANAPSMAADPRWRRVLGRMQRRAGTPRAAYYYWQNAVVNSDILGVLPDIRVPALVMHAVGDRIIPLAQGRAIAERIPGARFVELPGADHFPWFTNGDRLVVETQELLTGSRGIPRSTRRLCTVLFTDIVGSTTLAAHLGNERWRDLLSRHDSLLRSYLLRYGGEELGHTGDGALVLFDDPLMALDSARALTQAVVELGLQIRAGLHAGVVEMREGGVAGITVHIAARVANAAGASEVLVTRTLRDLLLGLGVNLEPRGTHEFKGVPERIELFALTGAHDEL